LRAGIRTYRAGFEEIGHRTRIFELSEADDTLVEALRSPRIRAVFSDGGWINTVRARTATGLQFLIDAVGKPLIMLINDNPCSPWLDTILARDRANQTTAFIDADFGRLWSYRVPQAGHRQTYVPASPALPPPLPLADRPVGVLAVVSARRPESYRDYVRDRFGADAPLRLFDAIVEAGRHDGLRPFSVICDEVCRALGLTLDVGTPPGRALLSLADQFIRAWRRQMMLERLSAHPVTIVGGAPGVPLHPDTRVLAPLPYDRLLDLYRHARSVVVAPPYAGGVTERMVHPMAAGALVIAPPTGLSDRLLGRDRLFVTVSSTAFGDLGACLDRAGDPRLWHAMTEAAHAHATRRFSPAATVRRFLMEPEAEALDDGPG